MKRFAFLMILVCAPMLAPAQVVPTAEVPAEAVVATIDGKNVTAGELRSAVANMPIEFTQLYRQNPQMAIQQMFIMNYLAGEAEKAKLGEQSPLKEQLALMRANVLASAMLSWENNHFPVTDEMAKEYYDKNKAKYQQAKIKVIMVGFRPAATGTSGSLEDIARAASEAAAGKVQRSEAEARTLAEDIVKQLRGGADFAQLVARYSDDPTSKAAGGDFGVVSASSAYSDDIKNAVLPLKPGEVANPIRQAAGFYVIRVEDRTGQSFESAVEPIRLELRQAHVNEWFSGIRDRFVLKVENPRFFMQPGTAPPAK